MGSWIIMKYWAIDARITLVCISSKTLLALTNTRLAFPLVSIVKYVNEVLSGIAFSHVKNEIIHI